MKFESEIFEKDHLRIVITDSGLGGLAVHGLMDKKLREKKINSNIDLIFYNAVAHHDYGYNTITEYERKIEVFDSALNGILKFNPDIILIACNTLSVIFNDTKFSKTINIPVLGIIDAGINLTLKSIDKTNSNIILFGTETTINSNEHKKKLQDFGLGEENIISQICKNLESEIQIDPGNNKVDSLIDKYVSQAESKIKIKKNSNYALLCCTHYGFSEQIFKNKINKIIGGHAEVLNPNTEIVDSVIRAFNGAATDRVTINNYVHSKVDVLESEIKNLGKVISDDSEAVAEALKHYVHDPELFKI